MPAMPRAVHHTAAGTDGAKFYIFGGRETDIGLSEPVSDVQVYDPATGKTIRGEIMCTGETHTW